MPITPRPKALPIPDGEPPDPWGSASFHDVTLVKMMAAVIASGEYAPGPLIMQLAMAATAEIMYQTGRWARPPGINTDTITPEEAAAAFRGMGRAK